MANDLVGLLTGISSTQQPMQPIAGTPGFAGMFGAQQAQGLASGLGRIARQGAPSNQERMQEAVSKLDLGSVDGLTTLAKLQQSQGDLAGASQTVAKIKKLQEQKQANVSLSSQTEEIAKGLDATHPQLAASIRLGNQAAMTKGIEILGAIPKQPEIKQASLVDVETNKTVGGVELKDGVPYKPGTDTRYTAQELEGKSISGAYVKPSTPLVSTVQTPQQKVEENNLKRQASYVDITQPVAAKALGDKQASTAILNEVDKGTNTGVLSNFIANQSANLQGVFELAGVSYPTSFSKPIEDQSVLKILQNEAIIPMMESQGKGFTDKDLEYQTKVLPGFTQPWQYNEAAATIKLHTAVNQIEENTFANQRSYLAEVTPLDHTTLWDDYLTKLPRSKTVQAERNGVKYKKMEVVQDGANLSQYWVKDKPRGFTLVTGKGNQDVTWADINKTAAANNKSVREFLAAYENQGLIVKGIY